MKGDTEKNIKIEKNIVKDKAYHIEMDSFHSGEDSFNARHKLLNLKVAPMFLDNQITLCLQVNDITKQDIIHRLIAKSKQKSKVLQKVTTTMKHPLRLAMIHLDNVCDPKISKTVFFQEKLKPIKFYFQLLRNSLNNFQDISSLSAGEFHTTSKQIDFYSICKQVLELINFSYSRKKIKFVFLVDSRINRHMITDKTRLKQILTNLLTQVSKFNNQSTVYLIVNRRS